MSQRFFIKRNDTSPALEVQLQDEDGNAIERLSTEDDVRFHMEDESGETVVDASAFIEDVSEARVSYAWDSTDTETAGLYIGEFEVTFSASGRTETFPNSSNLMIRIEDDLA